MPLATRDTPTNAPAFLITIDTEGDNLWQSPRPVTTRNAAHLPRFQQLCEKHGCKPTYLVNWEMCNCPVFQEFGRDALSRATAEIGMHLHAGYTPPEAPITNDDYANLTYLIDYPEEVMDRKIEAMTRALEDTFQAELVSHRAGRWAFDHRYARILRRYGYQVDCSVTPRVHSRANPALPPGKGRQADYTRFPEQAYFLDPDDISRPGASELLEVPMTIMTSRRSAAKRSCGKFLERSNLGRRIANRLWPGAVWFRPMGNNLPSLLRVMDWARADGRDYVECMLHSSELMAGGSRTFATANDIEWLYQDLETLFESARDRFVGLTLAEYAERHRARRALAKS